MKKYIVFPDVDDKAADHVVLMPDNFYIKTKACTDGVAVVIGDKDTGKVYSYTVGCDEGYYPILTHCITNGTAYKIEIPVLACLEMIIFDFMESEEESILEIDGKRELFVDELNHTLDCIQDVMEAEATATKSASHQGKKKHKRNKNANK